MIWRGGTRTAGRLRRVYLLVAHREEATRAMAEGETPMHERVEVLSSDGTPMTLLYGQLVGLLRLLHAEGEQLTGRHGFQIDAEVGEDGIYRAVAWRWAGEEETMEWQPLPFA